MTATGARSCASVAVVLGLLVAAPVLAHSEGLTPYRYVVAPPGVESEGPPEAGLSTQPLGGPGFAGTTDNQMQLTLPAPALAPRAGASGLRVQLDQLDPASLPPLPAGLEPEGNGYRLSLAYAPSGEVVRTLPATATLGLSAPAPPTGLYELVSGRWAAVDHLPVASEEGFSSVVVLDRPGTFLQAYDPAGDVAAPAAASTTSGPSAAVVAGAAAAALALMAGAVLLLRRRGRAA